MFDLCINTKYFIELDKAYIYADWEFQKQQVEQKNFPLCREETFSVKDGRAITNHVGNGIQPNQD